jgi:putative ABC transport system permease protein
MTDGKKVDLIISSVYKDLPANVHVRPKYIVNIFSLKPFIKDLDRLMVSCMGDGENNFWTQSFFVMDDAKKIDVIQQDLQKRANAIIAKFNLKFKFVPIIRKITDVHFDQNVDWDRHTRPMLEAFCHAKFMIEMAVKYADLPTPPQPMPSGWAAFLYLYDLR